MYPMTLKLCRRGPHTLPYPIRVETASVITEQIDMYQMTTILETKIRSDHNIHGNLLGSVEGGVTVRGCELFFAMETLSTADGAYQYHGDIWLKISYKKIRGWMAYKHKGDIICTDLHEILD